MKQGTCNLCGESCNNIIIDHTNCCICRNIPLELMCDICSSEIKRDMEELEQGKLNNGTGEIFDDTIVTEENIPISRDLEKNLHRIEMEVDRDLVKYRLSDRQHKYLKIINIGLFLLTILASAEILIIQQISDNVLLDA